MATRRMALGALSTCLLAPWAVQAQRGGPRRIGLLYLGSLDSIRGTGRRDAFLQGMQELGYVEGRDYILVERYAEGNSGRIPDLARELVGLKVDAILSTGGQANLALQQIATTIPVVVTISWNPVREGLAMSLARPGKNFTGLSSVLEDVFAKHVELLRSVRPNLSRIAVLVNPDNVVHPALQRNVDDTARAIGIRVLPVAARRPEEFAAGFAAMAREGSEALIILGDSFFVQHFPDLAVRSLKQRIASTYSGQEYPEAGGLMSYGPSFRENFRRAAAFVDKILRGAAPADLPFEQPVKLEMVVNLKTARALGIALSDSFMMRADRIIE